MAGKSVPIRVVFTGSTADLEAAFDRAAAASDEANNKMVYSARSAAAAAVEQAKQTGASSNDIVEAAAKGATAYEEASKKISSSAVAAGAALAEQAKNANASIAEQSAAYDRGVAAVIRLEDAQKRATEAAKVAGAEQAAAAKAAADAQADQAAKMDLLQSKMSGLGEKATGLATEISKIGGVGFAASIAGMGDLAAKFQTSTHQIAANSDISARAAMGIGKAFLATSGQSIFSAKDMADAFAQVAGQLRDTEGHALSAAQATRVMAAADNLAEATSVSLGDSTAALATVMQSFHLSVGQASSASDTLFNVSRALNVPLDTVAASVNKLHGRLGTLAPSLHDVGGLMIDLSQHGIQGSRGIQVANTAMQTLIGGSQNVDQVLGALGVNIFNAQGKFVGLQSVISQLRPKMAALSQQNQDLAAKTLFGTSAAQVMLGVIERGPDEFQAQANAAGKAGTAAKAAAEQNQTLGKQLDILKATVDNAATSLGLKLLPALTSMTKGLESGVQWLMAHKQATEDLAIAIGTVLAGAVSVFAYEKATAFLSSVGKMGQAMVGLGAKVRLGAAQTEGAMTTTATTVVAADGTIVSSTTETATAVDAAIGSTGIGLLLIGLATGATVLATHWKTAWDGIKEITETVANFVDGKLNDLISLYNSTIGQILGDIGRLSKVQLTPTTTQQLNQSVTQRTNQGAHNAANRLGLVSGMVWEKVPDYTNRWGGHEMQVPAMSVEAAAKRKHMSVSEYAKREGINVKSLDAALYGTKLSGKASSMLTSGQQQFGSYLTSYTGMNPNVVAAWMLAEQSGSAARYYQGENNNDWLNIGVTGAPGSQNFFKTNDASAWTNPRTAAQATAEWLSGQTTLGGYGNASSGIQSALARMKGASPAQQVALLQGSGWAASGYPALMSDYQMVTGSGGVETQVSKSGSSTAANGKGINLASLLTATSPAAKSGQTLLATLQSALETGSLSTLRNLTTPAEQQKISQQEGALRGSGNAGLANQIAATMKQIFQTLSQSMLANQINYQAQALSNQAQEISDRTQLAQGHGQDELNVIKAAQQRVTDMAADHVTRMKNVQQATDDATANAVTRMKDMQQVANDMAANVVTRMKDVQQAADDMAANVVTHMKDMQQKVNDESASTVQHMQDMTQITSDSMAAMVAAMKDAATVSSDQTKGITDAINDQAQVTADTLGEKGLYGLKLVAQQLQVQADVTKAGFDQQIDKAQQNIDVAQQQADLQESAARMNLDQVTAAQHSVVALAQIHMDQVTMSQDAKVAKAQAHMDQVTTQMDAKVGRAQAHMDQVIQLQDSRVGRAQVHADNVTTRQDTKVAAAQGHMDLVAVRQDGLIAKAQAHADAMQLHVDTSLIGPAQMALDMNANASQSTQSLFQAQLSRAQGSGSQQVNRAQLALADVTSTANDTIQRATNAYQDAQSTANRVIQGATDAYQSAQGAANKAIQQASDTYNSVSNSANRAIQAATDTYNSTSGAANKAIQAATDAYDNAENVANVSIQGATTNLSNLTGQWNVTIQTLQNALTGAQNRAAVGEAAAAGRVTTTQAEASTEFAGSGLVVNMYGMDLSNAGNVAQEMSWAVRSSGLQVA